MAKSGMKRPSVRESYSTESNKKDHFPKNEVRPVPEIQDRDK